MAYKQTEEKMSPPPQKTFQSKAFAQTAAGIVAPSCSDTEDRFLWMAFGWLERARLSNTLRVALKPHTHAP